MQLSDILYKVSVCSNGTMYEYDVYAQNERMACQITRELFVMEMPNELVDSIGAQVVYPTEEEKRSVNMKLINVYGGLKSALVGKKYRDFLMAFQNYEGYNLNLKDDLKQSFKIKFRGFVVEVVFMNGETSINESEITYTDFELHRTYVIRDGLQNMYIGV